MKADTSENVIRPTLHLTSVVLNSFKIFGHTYSLCKASFCCDLL